MCSVMLMNTERHSTFLKQTACRCLSTTWIATNCILNWLQASPPFGSLYKIRPYMHPNCTRPLGKDPRKWPYDTKWRLPRTHPPCEIRHLVERPEQPQKVHGAAAVPQARGKTARITAQAHPSAARPQPRQAPHWASSLNWFNERKVQNGKSLVALQYQHKDTVSQLVVKNQHQF